MHEAPSFSELNAALAVYLEDLQDAPPAGNGTAAAEAPVRDATAARPGRSGRRGSPRRAGPRRPSPPARRPTRSPAASAP